MNQGSTRHQINLTTAEAAERLGLAPGTLQNWRSSGIGPTFLRINGSRVRYPLASLEEFEAAALVRTVW